MRWEDERYVRLYTRDTPDWLELSFEAQGLLGLIMRKLDRAGVLELGRKGARGVALAIGHPHRWSTIEPALKELLDDGCFELHGDKLVMRNYIEGQEARASDKARQREKRERDRARAAGLDPEPTPTDVTDRDISDTHRDEPSRIVTESHDRSHDVTGGHAASHAVTPSRAVPSVEEHSPPTPSRSAEGGPGGSAGPPATGTTVVHCPTREHTLNPSPMEFRMEISRALGTNDLAAASRAEDEKLTDGLRTLWGQGFGPDLWPVAGAFLAAGGLRAKTILSPDASWLIRNHSANLRWLFTAADAWSKAGRPELDAKGRPAGASGPPKQPRSPHVTGHAERMAKGIAEAKAAWAAAASSPTTTASNVVPLRPSAEAARG